jgi:hypothetical protein
VLVEFDDHLGLQARTCSCCSRSLFEMSHFVTRHGIRQARV